MTTLGLLGVSLGSAVTSLLAWFAGLFLKLWNAIVELFKWLSVTAYNYALDAFEFMFEKFVDSFCVVVDYFPDVDLSGLDEGLTTLLEYWRGFDQLLPLTKIFFCVNFLFMYFTVFTVIRLVVKCIPTIG